MTLKKENKVLDLYLNTSLKVYVSSNV